MNDALTDIWWVPDQAGLHLSYFFCVARNEQKGELEMNTLEVKVIKGILGGMICFGVAELIAETQILGLNLRLRNVEKNVVAQSNQAKEDAE